MQQKQEVTAVGHEAIHIAHQALAIHLRVRAATLLIKAILAEHLRGKTTHKHLQTQLKKIQTQQLTTKNLQQLRKLLLMPVHLGSVLY